MIFSQPHGWIAGVDPTENQIQMSIISYMRQTNAHDWGWTYHSVPNQGRNKSDKIHAWKMGQLSGAGDILIIDPNRMASYMEVKRCDGVQSGNQVEFERHCEDKGMPYFIVRSLDDALVAFNIIGFPELGK